MSTTNLGYKDDTIIHFKWIMYSNDMTTKFPTEHILNFTGPDLMKAVLMDILDQDVGCSNKKITAQFLLQQGELIKVLKALISGWKPRVVKEMCKGWCTKSTGSTGTPLQAKHCTDDKCTYSAAEVTKALAACAVTSRCESPSATVAPVENLDVNDGREVKKRKIEKENCSYDCKSDECWSSEIERKMIMDEVSRCNRASAQPSSLEAAGVQTSTVEPNSGNRTLIPMKYPMSIKSLMGFMHSFIHKFIPLPLLGSASNRRHFCKSLKSLLMCGHKDEFCLSTLMSGIKINDFKWTEQIESMPDKHHVVAKILVWIVQKMVLTVIRTFFYATESDVLRYMILYYPKNVWQQLMDLTLNQLQKRGSLLLTTASKKSENLGTEQRQRECSRIRFIPKISGMRPICPLGNGKWNKSDVLKMQLLTSSVAKSFGKKCLIDRRKTSIADVWSNYLQWLQKLSTFSAPLYVVKLDIADAYGSVLHAVLLQVLKNFVAQLPAVVQYQVYQANNSRGKGPRHYVMKDKDGNLLEKFEPQPHWHPMGLPIIVNVRATATAIMEYIECQYVSAGRCRKYRITTGIVQGGFLSAALCEMYYSSMYSTHWLQLIGPKDVCMRSVDDFLFVSVEKTSAEKFLATASKGVPEYNCYINARKTVQNVSTNGSPLRVPFCGITLCSHSRQFLVSAGSIISVPPRYTLKIAHKNKPAQFIPRRLLMITNARLRNEVVHPNYTSLEGLITNIYRTGISVGARLEALCRLMPSVNADQNVAKLIGSKLVFIVGKFWKRLKSFWTKKKGCAPSLPHALIVATYLGGVHSVLGLKGHMQLKKVKDSIGRLRNKFASQVPSSHHHLLPSGELKRKGAVSVQSGHTKVFL